MKKPMFLILAIILVFMIISIFIFMAVSTFKTKEPVEVITKQGLELPIVYNTGGLEDTKKVLKFIKENLSSDVLVNLMDQYYPCHKAFEYKEISKSLDSREYNQAYKYGKELGLRLD